MSFYNNGSTSNPNRDVTSSMVLRNVRRMGNEFSGASTKNATKKASTNLKLFESNPQIGSVTKYPLTTTN